MGFFCPILYEFWAGKRGIGTGIFFYAKVGQVGLVGGSITLNASSVRVGIMMSDPLGTAIRRLLRRVSASPSAGLSDAELLERFVHSRDEAAIETLMWRHGPMVLATCRRLLNHDADSEDCFQATFLVLCRRAATISKRPSVGSWLYKVAYRICLRARAARARRPVSAAEMDERPEAETVPAIERKELRDLLDDELNRLPERYRTPLVLHYLEEKTVEQIAQELGWRPGTVSSRLARGKDLLRVRLADRGLTLSTVAATAALASETANAAVPLPLVRTTLQALSTGAPSQPAASLAQEFLRAQLHNRLKWAVALFLTVGIAVGGTRTILTRDRPDDPNRAGAPNADAPEVAEGPLRLDADGDPLPQGAILRLGSARLRGSASAAAFSPDGRLLFTVGYGSLHTWDSATGRPLQTHNHKDLQGVSALSPTLSAETNLIATQEHPMINADPLLGRITLRNMGDLSVHHMLEVPGQGGELPFCFSGDGKRLAARGNREFLVWDTRTGKLVNRLPLRNEKNQGYLLALSPDGKLLAGQDFRRQTVRLWDVDSGMERKPLAIPGKPLGSAEFSGNGSVLMTTNSEIQLWNPWQSKLIRSFAPPAGGGYPFISFSGKIIATQGGDSSIHLLDATTGTQTAVLPRGTAFRSTRKLLAFSPDDKYLVLTSGAQIEIWNVATARRVRVSAEPDLAPHAISCEVAISPDGKILAACRCGTLQLWDARTGQKIGRDHALGNGATRQGLAFSSDGQFLIVQLSGLLSVADLLSSTGSNADLHPAPFPRPAHPYPWLPAPCNSPDVPLLRSIALGKWPRFINEPRIAEVIALSPQGDTDARIKRGANNDQMVSLRDFKTGKEVSCVPCAGGCWSAVFFPDGRRIAVGSAHHVKLWDIVAGREVRRFEETPSQSTEPGEGIRGPLAISPDGSLLAAPGADNSIRLWDVATGRERSPLRGHHGVVQSLAFFPDGKRLLSGSSDTTALVWDLSAVLSHTE